MARGSFVTGSPIAVLAPNHDAAVHAHPAVDHVKNVGCSACLALSFADCRDVHTGLGLACSGQIEFASCLIPDDLRPFNPENGTLDFKRVCLA